MGLSIVSISLSLLFLSMVSCNPMYSVSSLSSNDTTKYIHFKVWLLCYSIFNVGFGSVKNPRGDVERS